MSKQSAPPICKHPDHITSYFSMQKGILAVITVSGLIYNLGLMARPWFEGQMIQCLFFIQKGQSHFSDMLKLASAYFIAIFTVQISRFIKRNREGIVTCKLSACLNVTYVSAVYLLAFFVEKLDCAV